MIWGYPHDLGNPQRWFNHHQTSRPQSMVTGTPARRRRQPHKCCRQSQRLPKTALRRWKNGGFYHDFTMQNEGYSCYSTKKERLNC
jgi:hypothetical protein